jgi:hypothetical protein
LRISALGFSAAKEAEDSRHIRMIAIFVAFMVVVYQSYVQIPNLDLSLRFLSAAEY